jgi:hypothetical protein
MAGLGETCSHIGSLLWAIEAGVRIRDSKTVTQKKAYWVIPSAVKEVSYAKIGDMNFQGKVSTWKSMKCHTGSNMLQLPSRPASPAKSDGPDIDKLLNVSFLLYQASHSFCDVSLLRQVCPTIPYSSTSNHSYIVLCTSLITLKWTILHRPLLWRNRLDTRIGLVCGLDCNQDV